MRKPLFGGYLTKKPISRVGDIGGNGTTRDRECV